MSRTLTVLDGGMGRELLRMGAPFRQPQWSALALTEGPEWIVRAHTNFIDAGADVVTTNSYAIVPFHIGEDRFVNEANPLADIAGRCARAAARTCSGDTIRKHSNGSVLWHVRLKQGLQGTFPVNTS